MIDTIRNIAITFPIVWAIVFGVNFEGKHYGLSYSKNGVTIHFGN